MSGRQAWAPRRWSLVAVALAVLASAAAAHAHESRPAYLETTCSP